MDLIKAGNLAALAEAPIKKGQAYMLRLHTTHPLNADEAAQLTKVFNETGLGLSGPR
jgi:hypothetical protein